MRDSPSATVASPLEVVRAYVVHALTASGAILAFLAFLDIEAGRFIPALGWLTAALLIDGIDGPLARLAQVRRVTPRIDGTTLDLVVDYLTFVFLPALLIYRAGLVPAPWAAASVGAMLLSSLYHYARTDLKTADNYFRGFPAFWNIVAFYLYVGRPGPTAGLAVVWLFALLTFLPVLFVHPVRVRDFRPWLPIAAVAWAVSSIALLVVPAGGPAFAPLMAVSLAGVAVLLGAGVLRTARGEARAAVP